ncbi:MAG: hypothetical protein COA84_08590 [Robiginitomaculum sp.]|nr:MAG: hypothetical protein COA84_08590 [Robiginitomaculum sp.]
MANSKEAQPIRGFFGTNTAEINRAAWHWRDLLAWARQKAFFEGFVRAPTRGSFSLWAPWSFCAGAALYFYPRTEPNPLWPVLLFVLCAGLVAYLVRRADPRTVWLAFIMALVAAFLAGWGLAQWRSFVQKAPLLTTQSKVYKGQGLVLAVDKERGHRARYLIKPSSLGRLKPQSLPERIRISGFINDAEPGQSVRFTAALQAPQQASFPGGYDFARSAWFKRIGGSGFSYGHIKPIEGSQAAHTGFRLRLAKIRRALALRIRSDLGGQKGAIAAALVTGDRSAINEETAEDLRMAGLAHMLAISGLHMGLVAGLVFAGGGIVLAAIPAIGRRYDARKPAALLGLLVALIYLFLSGGSAPTQRAFVMTAVVLSAVLFDRRALSLRTISLAALIVAILRPESVISPGFQMSFAAALALIAFYDWAGARVQLLPRPKGAGLTSWLMRIASILGALALTSLIAGLATGPFAAFYFNRTAIYGLLANVAAMPVFTFVVMPSLLAGAVLDSIGAGAPFFVLAGWGLDIVLDIAHKTAQLPGSVARIAAAPSIALGAMALGIVFMCLMRQKRRLWGLLFIGIGALLWGMPPHPDGIIRSTGGALRILHNGKETVLGYGDFSRFEVEQFASSLGLAPTEALRLKKAARHLSCDASGCSVSVSDGRLVTINLDPGHLAEDCRLASLVVVTGALAARNAANCDPNVLIAPIANDQSALLYLKTQPDLRPMPKRGRLWHRAKVR